MADRTAPWWDIPEYQRTCLQAAARLAPDHAEVQIVLGQAEQHLYESAKDRPKDNVGFYPFTPHPNPLPGVSGRGSCLSATPKDGGDGPVYGDREPPAREHLFAALRHFLRARDLCPILPEPHVRLAAYVEELEQADTRDVYLARAKLLPPCDPRLWYLCGLLDLADGRPDQAWRNWQRSLELSGRFLTDILDHSVSHLDADGLLERVLPDQADLLLAAADHLYPPPQAAPQRRLLLRKAVALFDGRPGGLRPEDWHIKAMIHGQLGEPAEALLAYQAALAGRPLQADWRFELAQLLYEQERWLEAQREVRVVLDLQPRHAPTRELAAVLARLAAEGKIKPTAP